MSTSERPGAAATAPSLTQYSPVEHGGGIARPVHERLAGVLECGAHPRHEANSETPGRKREPRDGHGAGDALMGELELGIDLFGSGGVHDRGILTRADPDEHPRRGPQNRSAREDRGDHEHGHDDPARAGLAAPRRR